MVKKELLQIDFFCPIYSFLLMSKNNLVFQHLVSTFTLRFCIGALKVFDNVTTLSTYPLSGTLKCHWDRSFRFGLKQTTFQKIIFFTYIASFSQYRIFFLTAHQIKSGISNLNLQFFSQILIIWKRKHIYYRSKKKLLPVSFFSVLTS